MFLLLISFILFVFFFTRLINLFISNYLSDAILIINIYIHKTIIKTTTKIRKEKNIQK